MTSIKLALLLILSLSTIQTLDVDCAKEIARLTIELARLGSAVSSGRPIATIKLIIKVTRELREVKEACSSNSTLFEST